MKSFSLIPNSFQKQNNFIDEEIFITLYFKLSSSFKALILFKHFFK